MNQGNYGGGGGGGDYYDTGTNDGNYGSYGGGYNDDDNNTTTTTNQYSNYNDGSYYYSENNDQYNDTNTTDYYDWNANNDPNNHNNNNNLVIGGGTNEEYYSHSGNTTSSYYDDGTTATAAMNDAYYYEGGGDDGMQQQLQQQQHYDGSGGGGTMEMMYDNYRAENPRLQMMTMMMMDNNNNNNHHSNHLQSSNMMAPTSLCYPSQQPPFVIHPNGEPDNYGNYNTQGDPISALALDRGGGSGGDIMNDASGGGGATPSLLYVASHTSKNSGGGRSGSRGVGGHGSSRIGIGGSRIGGGTIGGSRRSNNHSTLTRGSRMTVLYDDDGNDDGTAASSALGNKSVYSSFVAHPEAEGRILDCLHGVLFGGGITAAAAAAGGGIIKAARPSHAFGPPFGTPSSIAAGALLPAFGGGGYYGSTITASSSASSSSSSLHHRPEDRHCMGITSILPFATPHFGSGGRVCTISPHGVRIHTRGGVVMSEKRDLLSGMVCGVLMDGGGGSGGGGGNSSFATVGGMSCPSSAKEEPPSSYYSSSSSSSSSSATRRPHHVHCIDLHRDLKIVSSHTLVRDSGSGGSSSATSGGMGRNGGGGGGADDGLLCVTHMAANYERNNLVVGCSDGTIRILDGGRRQAEVAKAKAQSGGVAQVAVHDNLVCVTGYTSSGVSSAASPLPYPFPAQHVLIYDVRYLGRGGFPHVFSANRGGPRFATFLPSDCYFPDDGGGGGVVDGGARLLVGSGQTFGGFEVITPFQTNDAKVTNGSNFFQPALNAGESMTTVTLDDGELFIGSSYGRVLQYGLTNYQKTMHMPQQQGSSMGGGMGGGVGAHIKTSLLSSLSGESFGGVNRTIGAENEQLDIPPFVPPPPELSIDPTILCSSINRTDPRLFQGWDIFDSYTMTVDPIVSDDKALFHPRYARGNVSATTLGPMSKKAMIPPSKRWLSKTLQTKLEESAVAGEDRTRAGYRRGVHNNGADFMKVFPTSSLELSDDLLEPCTSEARSSESSAKGKGARGIVERRSFPNPNKLIYSVSSFAACYDATADPRKAIRDSQSGDANGEEDFIQNEENGIPYRYRLMARPPFYKVTNFDYSRYNETGLWVGWDYSPTFSNSFACSVLTLLYFIPEIRSAALQSQVLNNQMAIQSGKPGRRETSVSITAELGLLFHLIENLSANGMIYPDSESKQENVGQVKAFVPSNIISSFLLLPEARNLALLDGVAGAAEIAKRPEALYRFIMHYFDKEFEQLNSTSTSQIGLIDPIQGISFISIIEFSGSAGKPKISNSRALTLDLSYDKKNVSKKGTPIDVRFGEILLFSICKEIPLRAWCDESSSYESVIQRKVATSLPKLLSISCCCAGKLGDKHGLELWQQEDKQNWLPEFIEVQIETDQSITVKELAVGEGGKEEWITFKQKLPLPASVLESMRNDPSGHVSSNLPIKKSYRLEAVCSFIRNSKDPSSDSMYSESEEGHHVIHVRVPRDLECEALARQLYKVEECIAERESSPSTKEDILSNASAENYQQQPLTIASKIALPTLQERKSKLLERLSEAKERATQNIKAANEWLLFNGFVITNTSSDDVRSFNAKFKEPSLVMFREIEVHGEVDEALDEVQQNISVQLPSSVMDTASISTGCGPKYCSPDLPKKGDLIAIDAEFVCVQAEESLITPSGSKEITSESRNSLARLSMIDCRKNAVLVDDYILQRENVTDHLTRFSGIRENDLDPKNSPHHLVTMQEAYLKVRLFLDRGCVFVGHGLSQDFRVINICVPPNQIIDTSVIYHQPNQRYISLRYLTNYVLGRDMQQEVHDSIEDARAAHELYVKALTLKSEGIFDDFLIGLYTHGHKTQFKLGVHDEESKRT